MGALWRLFCRSFRVLYRGWTPCALPASIIPDPFHDLSESKIRPNVMTLQPKVKSRTLP